MARRPRHIEQHELRESEQGLRALDAPLGASHGEPRLAQVQPRTRQIAPIDSPWLTAEEAIGYLRLGSRTALTRAMHENRLPYHRLGTRLRFYRPELDAWILNTGSGAVAISGVA